jgi:hypothetical protein
MSVSFSLYDDDAN